MNTLSTQQPLPSMLTWTFAAFSSLTHSSLVNWLPWSVFMISGQQPAACRASLRASTQNAVSIVLEIFHDKTARLCQSMIAIR